MDIQSEMPKNPQQVQAEQDAAVKESLGKIKNKILVMSGKGGVGKTSTSVNLSIALANKGFDVGIIVEIATGSNEYIYASDDLPLYFS